MRIRKLFGKSGDCYIVVDDDDPKEPLAISYFAEKYYAERAIKLLKNVLVECGIPEPKIIEGKMT